jgi:hypothetical protein
MTTKPQVFLSHAHEDADFANMLRSWIDDTLLGAVGFFVSSDRTSIPLGSEWANRIREALAQSSLLLVLVSPTSMSRRWLYFEAGAGYIRNIPLVPVCIAGMELRSLEPPLSFFEAIQLPGKEAELRLMALIASSAALRMPRALPDLTLPGRVDKVRIVDDGEGAETGVDQSLLRLTKPKAKTLLGRVDQKQLQIVRDLVREASFAMDLTSWEENEHQPKKILARLISPLKNPVLIPKDVADSFLEHATELAESYVEPTGEGWDKVYAPGYERVRDMLEPFINEVPSLTDYEIALFQYPPKIYVPLLLSELGGGPRSGHSWNALQILADSEYGSVALHDLANLLSEIKTTGWILDDIVRTARQILGEEFDAWYEKVRGRSYSEDVAFLEAEWDKRRSRLGTTRARVNIKPPGEGQE